MTSTVIYTLNFYKERSTLLKTLEIENFDLLDTNGEEVEFDPHENDYMVNIFAGTLSLNVTAIPFDDGAEVTLFGFSYIRKSINAYVKVSLPGYADTVYNVKILKGDEEIEVAYNYSYTGQYQEFVAPYSSYYKIELWGAQGGNSKGNNNKTCSYNRGSAYGSGCGGFGSYTSGWIYLKKDTTLYFYIGQRGPDAVKYKNVSGSWNGGGGGTYDHSDDEASGAGGGASDVRLVNTSAKTTWDEFNSLKSRIMVAAGGGGGSDIYEGGHGGTTSSQSKRFSSGVNQNSGYRFGLGETGVYRKSNIDVAGGGGGYFGGRSTAASSSNYGNYGQVGTGGSSYVSGCSGCMSISESSTSTSSMTITSDKTHYSGYAFKNISMLAGASSQPSTSSGYSVGHSGNGYGKITMLNLSENNYLNNLNVYDVTKTSTLIKSYNIIENEDGTSTAINENISFEVDSNVTSVKLNGRPDEDKATVSGNGTFYIDVGVNVFIIQVTAENNDVRTYTISISREADTNKYPNNITINGLVNSLCSRKEGLCILSDRDNNQISWDKYTDEYDITVPSRIKQLRWNVEKAQVNQVIIGGLTNNLESGYNPITIEVKSEACARNYTDEEISNSAALIEECISSYKYNVYRDVSDDSDLSDLYIDAEHLDSTDPGYGVDFDLNYTDWDVYNYYFSVPSEWTYVKNLVAIADAHADGATVEITGNNPGSFEFRGETYIVNILVTAPDGVSTSTYKLHVYREKDSNIFVSEMKAYLDSVDENNIISLDKEFRKTVFDYSITIENNKDSIILVSRPESEFTNETISVNNSASISTSESSHVYTSTISNLKTGKTVVSILSTSQNNETQLYTLTIFRKYNSDSTLSSIDVSYNNSSYGLTPVFSPNIYEYCAQIDSDMTSIFYSGVATRSTSTVKYLDNNTIKLGTNIKRILVTAEDGSYSIYTLYITRPASANNNLLSLKVTGNDNIEYGVDLTEESPYNITVPNNVSNVTISSSSMSKFASIKGNGKYYLSTQAVNNITVSVTAENGEVQSYEINITRTKNGNAYLSSLGAKNLSLNESFVKTSFDYTITVPYTVESTNLTFTPEVNTTSVVITNDQGTVIKPTTLVQLVRGANLFTFTTLAEDGVSSETYTLTINKNGCPINTLKNIYTLEASLIPTFKENTNDYTIKVPFDIDEVNFVVEKKHDSGNVGLSGDSNLVISNFNVKDLVYGNNHVNINVTPEDGVVNVYTFNIIRQEEGEASNYLSNLKLSNGTLSPSFNKLTNYYEVTVPYETLSTVVSYTLEDVDATAVGEGKYTLKDGENTIITVTVTATDGYTRDYVIKVFRQKSTDATLRNLSVNRTNLSPSFNSNITLYELSTTNGNLVFDDITPTMEESTYVVLNNEENTFVENGTVYSVTIKVTAPDGHTSLDYVLNVKKVASKNFNLSSLEVVGYSLSPAFSPNVTSYTVNVENDVTNVLVEATTQDTKATIEGNGVIEVSRGDNYIEVKVTAESGDIKSYVVKVVRAYSDVNNIEDIILNNAIFVDTNGDETTFDKTKTTFDILLDGEEDKLDMNIFLEDENSTYDISGNDFANKSSGVVTIIVTAENGTTKTYTLNVTKKKIVSDLLTNLYDRKYGLNPGFNRYINNYNLTVDYEYNALDLAYTKLDSDAIVEIIDNILVVGENTVTVKVTSSGGDPTINYYYINVTKNPEIENFLDYLYTDYNTGDFNETFNSRVNNYTLNVSTDTTSIQLFGEPVTKKSKVVTNYGGVDTEISFSNSNNSLGTFNLNKGVNTIYIKVTLESKTRTYIVNVTRAFDSNAILEELEVSHESTKYTLTPEFSPNVYDYTLNVDAEIYTLDFNGVISPLATATGFETIDLKGGTNTHSIVVNAEDNTTKNTYTIIINKAKSDNANLVDLIPSSGKLEPIFTYGRLNYTMNVDSSVSMLSFEYICEDMNCKVSGHDYQVVPDGTSTRTVTVTAEDTITTQTYTITINKIVSYDAYLKSLSFKNYNFIDHDTNTTVTFDKDTFEYYVLVNNDKTTVSISDFTYELNDENSTVTYSGIIKTVTQNYVQFKFNVTAEDGFTENVYIVNIKRKKSSNSALASLTVNYGYLTQGFSSTKYTYDWYIPLSAAYLNDDSLVAVPDDVNAIVVKSDAFDARSSKNGELTYSVIVTSEDGSSVTTYVLRIFIDASSDVTLKEVNLSDGKMVGTLEEDKFDYVIHVYEDTTKMRIIGIPNSDEATIISDMDAFLLDTESEYTIKEIVVQAEDGETTGTYTFKIYRVIPTSTTIKDLYLNGLEETGKCTSKICTMSPSFSELVLEYRIVVPYEYNKLDVGYTLNNEQQTIVLKNNGTIINNKTYDLEVGETVVDVIVYDGLDNEGKTYKLTVKRNASSNAHLSSLVLSSTQDGNYKLSPTFDRDTFEYRTNASFDVTTLSLTATPEESGATYKTRGLTNLAEGSNQVQITVTAPDKITKLYYYVNVVVKPEFDAYLTNITVFSGVFFDLSPEFDESIFSYTSEVYSYSEYALVQASFDSTKNIRITGEGEYAIQTGINVINLTSELLDSNESVIVTSNYSVTVIRPVSSNVYLSNLKITSSEEKELLNNEGFYNLSPIFDRGTTDYNLTVSPGIKKLDIRATPGEESFKVRIYGNTLAPGKNIVDIIVVNEDSTLTKTYQVTVNVLPSPDARLKSITVKDTLETPTTYGVSSNNFDHDTKTYNVNVPYNIDKVKVEATALIDASVISGNGLYYLDYGNNVVTLNVLAEDETNSEIYTINIFRAYDLYLSDIKVDDKSLDDFVKTTDSYAFTVTNDVKKIEFKGIPEENNVSVTYSIDAGSSEYATINSDGVLTTGVGLNKVIITVTAPDNTFKQYHVTVTREQSDNNYLEYLEFDEGILREPFEKTNQSYTMYILDTYTSLDLDKATIIPEDITANYSVSGYVGFSKTSVNTVTIAVAAENGNVRNYTVEVTLKPEEFFMHYLKSLKLSYKVQKESGQETVVASLSPVFAQATRSYTVTVPYSTSSITVNAIPLNDDDDAILSASTESGTALGDTTYPINFGRNVINIKVASRLNGDDTFGMYKVIVYRNKNAVATLQSLGVKDHILSPSFNSTRTGYNIDIDSSESKLDITAIPTDPGATVEIIGNGNFHQGTNEIFIRVTAADGTTKKDYKIIANCTLSTNNLLSNLEVKDHSLSPSFDKSNTGVYVVNVDETETNAHVIVTPDKESSSVKIVTISGEYETTSKLLKLQPGNNYVNVQVTADSGDIKLYTLNIFRSYSTDNRLKDLIISDGELDSEFDPETLNYTVNLDGDLALLDTISIIGIKNDSRATVIGNGEYDLTSSSTIVTIKVKAESGDEREYTVTFVKAEIPSSKLKILDINEGEISPEFNKEGYKYFLTVPYEITSLDFESLDKALPESDDATVEILNNSNFKVGINIVNIKVTSTNGDYTNYFVYVTRSIDGNTHLIDLYVENQSISPIFDEDTLYYELSVSSSTESVVVHAIAQNNKATVSINGKNGDKNTINLAYGENKVYVNVLTDIGAERTYVIKVTRLLNEDNYLLTLTSNLGTWDKTFDKVIKEYTITVPAKTKNIVFSGTVSVGSTVTGLGSIDIKVGETTHLVSVTNDSGLVNNYNITIVRPGSTDASIVSITSNQGDLTLEDGVYNISVDNDVATIKFTVVTTDSDATVDMKELYNLEYNDNNFVILVIAEDGTTQEELKIHVYRYKHIESVNIIEESATIGVGEEFLAEYEYTPLNTDYTEFYWTSMNPEVATVDENGKITGVGEGITYAYITSTVSEPVRDYILVYVSNKIITSSVYDVWHLGESENDLANVDFSYVIGINDKTTVEDFVQNFDNNPDNLVVISNEEKKGNGDFVGSGMKLQLIINDHIYDEVVIVVRGDNGSVDKPGNGIVTSTDYATLSSLLAGLTLKTPMTSLLYDLNKNKILTVTDLSPLSLYIAGKATFTDLNGL